MKFFVVCATVVLLCEAKVPYPGLEDIEKCSRDDIPCLKSVEDRVTKVISKPYDHAPFSTKGYDPITIATLDSNNTEFKIDLHYDNLIIEGLGETKMVKLEIKDPIVTATFESNFTFNAYDKVTFHSNPKVVREGPISGNFSGVSFTVEYVLMEAIITDGPRYFVMGKENVTDVNMRNVPEFDEEQISHLVNDTAIKDLVDAVDANPLGYYKTVAAAMIEAVVPGMWEDRRNFYMRIPVSELRKE